MPRQRTFAHPARRPYCALHKQTILARRHTAIGALQNLFYYVFASRTLLLSHARLEIGSCKCMGSAQ